MQLPFCKRGQVGSIVAIAQIRVQLRPPCPIPVPLIFSFLLMRREEVLTDFQF